MIYLDTHIIVWLYSEQLSKFSETVLQALEENELYISQIVKLELQYLYEIKRISISPENIISQLYENIGLELSTNNFADIIETAMTITWTHDCFDRLIVAEAMLMQKTLITKDEKIRANFNLALW